MYFSTNIVLHKYVAMKFYTLSMKYSVITKGMISLLKYIISESFLL